MSVNAQRSLLSLPPRLKRLDFDDADNPDLPKSKRARVSQLSIPALSPCLGSPSPTPSSSDDNTVSRIGPYLLLNPTEANNCYRAIHTHTEQEYICKVFAMKRYSEVIAPYARLPPHPHVGQMAEVIAGDRKAYVLFQRGYGDMHSYVRTCKRLREEEAATLFRQMAEAVAHCHQHGIVLRDLKLRKFIFANRQRNKLRLENLDDACVLKGEDDSLMDKHGCPAYVGPEILNTKQSYSGRAADVWSLGVVLYTMLVGRYPFQDMEPAALFSKIRRGLYTVPDHISPKAKCLIQCILRRNPAERLTASEILDHPWFSSNFNMTFNSSSGPSTDQLVPDGYTEDADL
ncbi:tribbles homolog 3 [Chiloscyllium plagiosum]|uniref:tribbles homolog 3 n=1 Tax=Chiloscyllium plagiosum TaxID=36176 RepID=UPI001CB7D035|nr:tribbles homolog 3 [Chiloscyllium plagiosum]